MPVNWIVLDFLTHEALTYLNPIYAAFLSEQTNGAFDAGRMEDAQFLTDDLNCDRLRWTTVLDYSFHYSSTKAIPRHGEEDPYTILDDFAVGDAEVEKQFTNKVTAIVVFFLLFLTSARGQDSLSVPSATGFGTNKPKGKKRDDKNKFRTYIQVGKDYKRHRVNRGGTHASPVGHPRRGHVRTIVKKSDINDFSEVWVRPCWVGGNGK